ncbi:hypothetical protein AX17_007533 [Amanita inopinata Kibby_2008]|nr:hypothetical protein AX17_007533 [Amanita inopinata Kibby_2008]
MSDGSRLRQSWYAALNDAEGHFRNLLTSSTWKRLPAPVNNDQPKSRTQTSSSSFPDLSNVVVHRCDDVLRLVLDVPLQPDEVLSLEPWKAVLSTPELRQEWDPAVQDAHLVELFDPYVRICKTKFTLGWPANPRDAVTISRMFHDTTTLVDISTSLPRSPDEPAYLRPSPPYVRSHVALFAWCIQRLHPDTHTHTHIPKLRITCFWQHDFKSLWSYSISSSALHQQLCTMILGLFKTVLKRGARVPKLAEFGDGIAIDRMRYQVDREALTVDYALVPLEESIHERKRSSSNVVEYMLPSMEGWDVQLSTKASSEEVERLPWTVRAVRKKIPATVGPETMNRQAFVDIIVLRVTHESLRGDHEVLKVQLVIEVSAASRGVRLNGVLQTVETGNEQEMHDAMKVGRLPSRVRGEEEEEMLKDVESATGISIVTSSSAATSRSRHSHSQSKASITSGGSGSTAVGNTNANVTMLTGTGLGRPGERTPAAEKSVLSKVRRNYIYFSSLLQEPEAKWRQTLDARGVSITQLDSIDPTLVVYRAEATFVGVGLWDLYGAVVSAGARGYWDKTHDDVALLEDVNGLTELWHVKSKPAWPVNGRDSVVLKTVYKSPTSIHVFSFSADADPHLFPNNQIPPVDPNVIRTQVDLQGWAIEALSPTTTLLTLLEQSDMKGWTGKTSMPSQMITNVAGIGEFAIKCGGPPVVTRLSGAKKSVERFDWEKASFRVVYEAVKPSSLSSPFGRSRIASLSTPAPTSEAPSGSASGSASGDITSGKLPETDGNECEMIECEIRCDVDTWAASLDIVVDPPPQGISCLRRHKWSSEGGGLWLTLTHDPVYPPSTSSIFLTRRRRTIKTSMSLSSPPDVTRDESEEEEGKFRVIVRRAPGREKGLVMVNGTRVSVDIEDMPENEVRIAVKKKRVKPVRVPLDQPPVVSVIRRRRAEWGDDSVEGNAGGETGESASPDGERKRGSRVLSPSREWASAPKQASPLTKWWTYAVEQAVSAANAVVPASGLSSSPSGGSDGGSFSSSMPSRQKWPMQYALEALAWVMEEYAEDRLGANSVSTGGPRDSSADVNGENGNDEPNAPARSVPTTGNTPEGWTFAGEKAGLGVYRKLITEVSPIVPVHRGTKIIEGVSAEELAGMILHESCRKEWDDRYDNERVFESFGWGCETGFGVLKGGFPFRDRGFYLARVVARSSGSRATVTPRNMGRNGIIGGSGSVRGPTPLSKRDTVTSDLGIDGRRTGNAPGAIFIVNSSYSGESDSVARFSAAKYNEYGLPIGRVYVDAWILETLDPYDTREINVAIPSTRCTRVVAVDMRGSVPAAMNGMMNVGMVRTISALGEWVGKRLKNKSEVETQGRDVSAVSQIGDDVSGLGIAVPCVRMPGGGVLLREKRDDVEGLDRRGVAWSVRVRDEKRVLVKERFAVEERLYRCLMLVSVSSVLGGDGKEKDMEEQLATEKSPGRTKSPKSPSPSRKSVEKHDQSIAGASNRPAYKDVMNNGTSPPDTMTARGRAASSQHRAGLRHPTDLLLAEMVIDSKMYPDGYDIKVRSRMRSEEKFVIGGSKGDTKCIALRDAVAKTTDPDATMGKSEATASAMATVDTVSLLDVVASASASSTAAATTTARQTETGNQMDEQVLPLGYTVHTMPSSPMHSSGLAAESPMRHLIRLTLPTAQYQIQTVEDPLTGEMRSAPPKPRWLVEMEEGGSAVVEIEVRPRRDKHLSSSKKRGLVVKVNGGDVVVEGEKESLTSVGREELVDDRVAKMPVFTMVPNETEALPEMLRVPLAIADDLLVPAVIDSPAPGDHESQLAEEANADTEAGGESAGTATDAAHIARASGQANSGGLLGFLQGYPNPLTRFTTGSISSNNGSGQTSSAGTGPDSTLNASIANSRATVSANATSQKVPGGLEDLNAAPVSTPRTCPLPMVLIVALIAFLIGSLLRSLLSPADFIYVVRDLHEAEEAGFIGGWREIRRLFELKYVVGGWDFQVAVVRRHHV